jgi:hypothetical protein
MAIFRKRGAPNSPERTLREVYDNYNALAASVNRPEDKTDPRDVEGRSGDTRLVKTGPNTYAIELRFQDGWVRTDLATLGVTPNSNAPSAAYNGTAVYTYPAPEVEPVPYPITMLFFGMEE